MINQSDFIFHNFSGNVSNNNGYYKVETESNPDFIWGNYYAVTDKKILLEKYKTFQDESFDKNDFVALSYSDKNKCLDLIKYFSLKGFETEISIGMISNRLNKVEYKDEKIELGIVKNDIDWDEILHNQIVISDLSGQDSIYLKKRFLAYRKMASLGYGNWFFAKLNGRIVGDLGVYIDENIARFQQVETIKEARNMGVCKSLINYARNHYLNNNIEKFIIVAEENSIAFEIYKKLGFYTYEYGHSFLKFKS